MRLNKLNIQHLLWLALALALTGSLKHLAATFASVDGDILMGWLQAVAIDAGLFSLAYSIRKRRADRRSVKQLWAGVMLFSIISIYGNLAYGLFATTGGLPVWIVVSKPYILAGSLPILVIFLSDLLSDDWQFASEMAKREEKRVARLHGNVATQTQENKMERITKLKQILLETPDTPNTELARLLDVSRATVRNYKLELAGNGVVKDEF